MPVTVPCPTCAALVSVRDEYAGRRVRCPQCKTVLDTTATAAATNEGHRPPRPQSESGGHRSPRPPYPPPLVADPPSVSGASLPSLPPPPPPVRLAPIRASVYRPPAPEPPPQLEFDDDPADRSQPRSRRRDRDDEGEDEPRRKPKPFRRKTKPAAGSRGPVLWIVGGVVGLVVLVGGCAGMYFALLKPALDQAGKGLGLGGGDRANPNVTEANAYKMQSGMTLAEVVAVMGPGRAATEQDFVDAQVAMNDRAFTESMAVWEPKLRAGEVQAWANGKSRFLVGFDRPPAQGGTVVGLVAVIVSGNSKWSYKYLETRSGGGPGPPAAPVAGGPVGMMPDDPFPDGFVGVTPKNARKIRLGMTFAEVEAILGKVPRAAGQGEVGQALLRVDGKTYMDEIDYWAPLVVNEAVAGWAAGSVVIVVAVDGRLSPTAKVTAVVAAVGDGTKPAWTNKQLTPRPKQPPIDVSAVELTREYAADPTAASVKYGGRLVRLTGGVKSDGGASLRGGEYSNGKFDVFLTYRDDQRPRAKGLKADATVTVVGRVRSLADWSGNTKMLYVNDCQFDD